MPRSMSAHALLAVHGVKGVIGSSAGCVTSIPVSMITMDMQLSPQTPRGNVPWRAFTREVAWHGATSRVKVDRRK